MAIKIVSSVFYTCLICYPREMLKKYKKYGIFCYFLPIFSTTELPRNKILIFLSHFTCPTMSYMHYHILHVLRWSAILGPPFGVRPFTKTFVKLQYLGYIWVPWNKSLALGGTWPHSGPGLNILSFNFVSFIGVHWNF